MSEFVPVTRAELANALAAGEVLIDNPEECQRIGAEPPRAAGRISLPDALAEELLAECGQAFRDQPRKPPVLLPPPAGDPEIRAMQAITDALEPFGSLPPGPVERILRWACDRYLVACASCGRP